MEKPIVQFDRRFKIWLYIVSHGQLLCVVQKIANTYHKLMCYLRMFAAIATPMLFDGLTVLKGDQKLVGSSSLSLGVHGLGDRQIYLLSGSHWQGVIVAGAIFWDESDAEHFMDSKLIPNLD